MAKKSGAEVEYSTHSQEDGIYSLEDLTPQELEAAKKLAQELLTENEWITPLVPEVIIRNSIQWYAQLFIGELLSQITPQSEKPSLDEFKSIAKQYIITYNLDGAKWFKEAFEEYCLEELQNHFAVDSFKESGLDIVPIKIKSSSGFKSFNEVTTAETWDPDLVKGKHVISLDDIGDTGRTQEAIRRLAEEAGALSTILVNLTEKIVPENVPKKEQKKYHPDFALVAIAYFFAIGWGLDDGVREETRELPSISALSNEEPQNSEHSFQGSLATKSSD